MRLGLSKGLGLLISSAGLGLTMAGLPSGALASEPFAVRVGLLHSLQGTMRNAEYKLVEAEELAIAEINAAGGVLIKGRRYRIVPVRRDGASDWDVFAEQASRLIDQDQAVVLFGGWTSASRKAMLPVVEAKDSLLFYPISYEGQECSKNIFYTGAIPNQQSEPATRFMLRRSPAAGKPFFLVGSDYVFPRTSHAITKQQLQVLGGSVAGESYLPLGEVWNISPLVSLIKKAMPDGGAIINHLNGDQNIVFFNRLRDMGVTPENGYHVMSYTILEDEIDQIGAELLQGHYVASNYLMSVPTAESRRFIKAFKARYGDERVVTDPQESAYNMVYLWKAAAEKANSFEPVAVRKALVGVSFAAPQGKVKVMPNHHLAQTVRIGKISRSGQVKIVEVSPDVVEPQAWNQYERHTKGQACDWTDPAKGGRYRF